MGRVKADSVLDCAPQKDAIQEAIRSVYSSKMRQILRDVNNPYGQGGASSAIVEILEREPLENLLRKPFFDLPHVS